MKNKKIIGNDVKTYVARSRVAKKDTDFNKKLDEISFELSKLQLWDTFYDRRSK